MATYAIGDLQGCYRVFRRLLDKIDFNPKQDTLWLAGDLVNRGPESLATLQFIRSLGSAAISILGNHDLHLLAVAAGVREHKATDSFSDILNSPQRDEILDWLRHQKLIHWDANLRYTMVHAGIYPKWHLSQALAYGNEVETQLRGANSNEFLGHIYQNEPLEWHETLSGWERLRFIINTFTRMRYLSDTMALDFSSKTPIADAPSHLKPWFEFDLPALQETQILFGHWSALRGKTGVPHVEAIDTGCVWGFELTALNLENNQRICVNAGEAKPL